MDIFETCSSISDHIKSGDDLLARNELIKVLHFHEKEGVSYSPLVNHLIRETGLYPYPVSYTHLTLPTKRIV